MGAPEPLSLGIGAPEILVAFVWLPVLLAAVVIIVGLVVYFRRRAAANAAEVYLERVTTDPEQWRARTAAGPAVVTRVLDDRGWAYEIETSFRGESTRLHYVAPARAVAVRKLEELVREHAAREDSQRWPRPPHSEVRR